MEALLDEVVAYLSGSSTKTSLPTLSPSPSEVSWILGDLGTGAPQKLPFALVSPLTDVVKPYSTGGNASGSRGVDMDDYRIPIVVVQDLHNYADPIPSPNNSSVLEHPQYRALLELIQNIRQAMRENITISGLAATSTIVEIKYLLVLLGGKQYRAARLTLQILQRRPR